ncbi:hypothetical protein BC628DRAFT_39685 [Trametes gibbosa]|nr:hypothetical protein BC628DRAFT_39685 [Trametes gibbosa]
MPTKFRRPPPRDALSRTYSADDITALSQDHMSRLSSFNPSGSSPIRSPTEPLGPNEVFVYYDSAWSTDEVCFPPVRQRRGAHYQPNVVSRRAATVDAGMITRDDSPKSRPLVKAVGKAKGLLVKVVARGSIRKLCRRNEAGEMVPVIGASSSAPSLTNSTSGEWSEETTPSGVLNTGKITTHPAGELDVIQDSESRFSVHSTDCLAPPKLSRRPQNSNISAGYEPPTPPPIAEQDAYQLLNILICGPIIPEDLPKDSTDSPEGQPQEQTKTGEQSQGKEQQHSQASDTHHDSLLANVAHVILFLPWCILIGGAILLVPSAAGTLAFNGGFMRGPPPRGLRRFAYWAENAYEHAFVFIACLALLLYRDADPHRRAWTLAALVTRWAWVWLGYYPPPGLHARIGENDVESLWLIWKGKAVVDAIMHKERPCSLPHTALEASRSDGAICSSIPHNNECRCHGTCLLSCADMQEKDRE